MLKSNASASCPLSVYFVLRLKWPCLRHRKDSPRMSLPFPWGTDGFSAGLASLGCYAWRTRPSAVVAAEGTEFLGPSGPPLTQRTPTRARSSGPWVCERAVLMGSSDPGRTPTLLTLSPEARVGAAGCTPCPRPLAPVWLLRGGTPGWDSHSASRCPGRPGWLSPIVLCCSQSLWPPAFVSRKKTWLRGRAWPGASLLPP